MAVCGTQDTGDGSWLVLERRVHGLYQLTAYTRYGVQTPWELCKERGDMTTLATVPFTEDRVRVAGTELYVLKGGSGPPVLVLHGVEGFEGWLPFHDALATQATVYAPSHPGYGQTSCPEWVETIAHQAVFYHWFLQEHGLPPVDVVGIGIGGWIAAQMAVMCPQPIRHLVLVDAAGIRPQHDEVFDIFITPWRQVLELLLRCGVLVGVSAAVWGGIAGIWWSPRSWTDNVDPHVFSAIYV
jgi:pimeloyl-ACP methyl ester carboxylesterase